MNGHKKSVKKTLFIISSAIYINDAPLSYSDKRSVFDGKKREEQTFNTIKSIRKYCKNSEIILIDSGIKNDMPSKILKSVERYRYVGDNYLVRKACDSSKKGLGEAMSLIFGLKEFEEISSYNYIFKISGRYFLNNNFDIKKFNHRDYEFTFKKYYNPEQVSTRLYGFSPSSYNIWLKAIKKSLPGLFFNRSIEQLLFENLKGRKCNYIETLGVGGYVAPTGDMIDE